jgi:hypothetical protein
MPDAKSSMSGSTPDHSGSSSRLAKKPCNSTISETTHGTSSPAQQQHSSTAQQQHSSTAQQQHSSTAQQQHSSTAQQQLSGSGADIIEVRPGNHSHLEQLQAVAA